MSKKTPSCLSNDKWLVEALKGQQGYGKGYQSKRKLSELLHGDVGAMKRQEIAMRMARKGITSAVIIATQQVGKTT